MTTETDTLIARLHRIVFLGGLRTSDDLTTLETVADALAQRDAEIAELRAEITTWVELADNLEKQLQASWCGCGV